MAVRRTTGSPVLITSSWRDFERGVAIGVAALRGRHLFVLDLITVVGAASLALVLRYDGAFAGSLIPKLVPAVLLVVAVRAAVNVRLGLYARDWRFASIPELERVVLAGITGSAIAIALFYGMAIIGRVDSTYLPRSFWVAELAFSLVLLGGTRVAVRIAHEFARPRVAPTDRHAALLYGAGHTGVLLARWAKRNRGPVDPVGFLDDDPRLVGGTIAGLRVLGGLGSLKTAIEETGAGTLLITMPSAPGAAIRRVIDAARKLDIEVRTVPSMTDLLDGTMDLHRVRQVRVEDLLRRPIVAEHAAGVEALVKDQVVVVTGAAGSIGGELARQVFALNPRRLILVDRAESPLYLIHRELGNRLSHGQGDCEIVVELANVVSRDRMRRLIEFHRPSVILHAAAYKHVPMMEDHPSDAVQVNIAGTLSVLDASIAAGVEHFVFVSTDKAVEPSNAMGASKRIGELLVSDAARRTGRRYVSVRFGNVLGSNGSVVPIFQDQLERDEPLTVTHPDMTRFFMTIPEAAWLILDAAALGRPGGDLFVLDMADPVRIMDLAHDLVRLTGRDPESQPIEIVGLRPGEKLHERLFYDLEEVEPTQSPKVLRASSPPPPSSIRDDVRWLLHLADGNDEPTLRRVLVEYARGWAGHPAGGVASGDARQLVAFEIAPDASGAAPRFDHAAIQVVHGMHPDP